MACEQCSQLRLSEVSTTPPRHMTSSQRMEQEVDQPVVVRVLRVIPFLDHLHKVGQLCAVKKLVDRCELLHEVEAEHRQSVALSLLCKPKDVKVPVGLCILQMHTQYISLSVHSTDHVALLHSVTADLASTLVVFAMLPVGHKEVSCEGWCHLAMIQDIVAAHLGDITACDTRSLCCLAKKSQGKFNNTRDCQAGVQVLDWQVFMQRAQRQVEDYLSSIDNWQSQQRQL